MYVSSPLCCPSRSSILTGKYVHSHEAFNNSISGNCSRRSWQETQETGAFPVHLKQQGYTSFFAGKYFNQVGNSRYYGYSISVNGTEEKHGHQYKEDYYTDLINKHWLIENALTLIPEKIVTDIDNIFRNSGWDMVEDLVNTLDQRGLLDNTYDFFSSDNGYHLGQFSLPWDKRQLYEFDIRVPLMVRGPEIKPGQIREEQVMNIDLAPTFIELSGGSAPDDMDGLSLVPLLHNPPTPGKQFRDKFLVEHFGEHQDKVSGCPQYDGQGMAEFFEVYNLDDDPDELNNLVLSADAHLLSRMDDHLKALRTCRGRECRELQRSGHDHTSLPGAST